MQRPRKVVPEVVWTQEVNGTPSRLRLAPGGESFALGEYLSRTDGSEGLRSAQFGWTLWRGGGGQEGPAAEFVAADVVPLDRDRALAIVPASAGGGSS